MFSFRPTSLAIDSLGNVFCTDYYNNLVRKFDVTGALVTSWGSEGNDTGEFSYPSGIAVDAADNVFVADAFNNRIQQFNNAGTFVAVWGAGGTDYGSFNFPVSLAIHSSGRMYVADALNNRIQVFNVSEGPCFLASVLGEADASIEAIRNYRDGVLAKSAYGRQLIPLYYKMSARLVPVLEKNPSAKKAAAGMLKLFLPVIDLLMQQQCPVR